MRRIILILVILICAWFLWMESLSSVRTNPPVGPGTADHIGSLLDLVPASALLAVEIEGLERRWEEIRQSPPVAGLQEILSSCAEIKAERMVRLIGNRAVAFWAASQERLSIIPIAVLQPADKRDAEALLAGVPALSHRTNGETFWIGPRGQEKLLESFARAEGPKFQQVVPVSEMQSRLPSGGLVRGYLNPAAWRTLLLKIMDRTPSPLLQWPMAMLSVELNALRYSAFRRDFVNGALDCDGIVVFEPTRLPPEMLQILNPDASSVVMPTELPPSTMAVLAFRSEAQAWLPWLRYLADSDRHGPLRNLDFWLEEFQARYHRNLDHDLFKPLAGQGWLLLSNRGSNSAGFVLVMETLKEQKLEATLVDMVSWITEQIWIESLGTVVPEAWQSKEGGRIIHGVKLKTVVSEISGLYFQVGDGYLIAAGSPNDLRFGRAWIRALKQHQMGSATEASGLPLHSSLFVQGAELGKWLRGIFRNPNADPLPCFGDSILAIASQLHSAKGHLSYEPDGIRLSARISF